MMHGQKNIKLQLCLKFA